MVPGEVGERGGQALFGTVLFVLGCGPVGGRGEGENCVERLEFRGGCASP